MSAGGKVTRVSKDKMTKVNSSSQNGKAEVPATNRNQPTAEQIRMAQITSDRSEGDPEIDAKVKQISEMTGRSNDEVLTALYDCDYNADQAVDKLLESKEASTDEWQVIDKKKKQVATNKMSSSEMPSDLKPENQLELEAEVNHTDTAPRSQRDRAPIRFQRGRGRGSFGGLDHSERSRDNSSRDWDQGFESNRGRRRGNFGESRGRGSHRGGRSLHSIKFETQIDTWTNESVQNGDNGTQIGSWTDMTDEWTADEWNGSLNESCVFTPSASSRSAHMYSAANDVNNGKLTSSAHQGTTLTFESSGRQGQEGSTGDVGAMVGRTPYAAVPPQTNTATGQDSISQQYVAKESTSVGDMSDCYGNMSDRNIYVSHYNKEATECLKSVMGIGRSSLGQNSPNMEELSRTGGQPLVNLQHTSQIQRVKQARPRLPPPSKIPSMPVEMPDSMNSGRLDVQFGNWDIMPLAADSNISFMADIISSTPEYAALMSSSQSSSVSGASVATQPPPASSFESSASKSSLESSESSAPQSSKASSFPAAIASGKTINESLLTKVVSVPPSSSSLLTAASKAGGSVSSQLGFTQMAYSSPAETMSSKLPMSNGPSHYGSSFGYQSGTGSLTTLSSDYSLPQGQLQYTYGDGQRFGVSGPQAQPEFGPTSLPPGYNSGPLPSQLHYSSSQGPVKLFHVPDKQATGTYSVGSEISGFYQSGADKQGAFPATLSQTFDSTAAYKSADGFHGESSQSSSTLLPYSVVASGLSYEGMPLESVGYDASQYPNQSVYRQREGQTGYDIAAADLQRNISTTGATFSGSQGQTSQSFGSSYGSQVHGGQTSGTAFTGNSGGPGQTALSTSGSFSGQSQSTSVTYGSHGQNMPSGGLYGNQRHNAPSAGSAFANHVQGSSQSFGGQGQGSESTTTIVQSGLTANLVSSTTASGKLADGLSKLNLKDGQSGESGTLTTSLDSTGASSAGSNSSLMPVNSSVTSSMATSVASLSSKASMVTSTKATSQTSKPMPNIPPGMPAAAAAAAMLNHNYMIGQPPGFQLAAFSYAATQQPITYSSYEELQMLQQRFSMPTPYYDVSLQTTAALSSRDSTASLGAQSYTGNDMKLSAMDVLSPVNAQPTQQPQAVTGNQQAYINHALHPAYSYYYPGATGILPYYPMVPMAIPSVTNPALAGTTSTTQYQKPAVYGSHAYAIGGQTQDFAKTFGGSQVPNKPGPGVATGIGSNSSDLMSGAGGFGKTHVQTYERGGFHAGTPPPSFSLALPSAGGTQAGALGAPAVYAPPYMPLVPHQQSHSQLLHHAIPQESGVAGRAAGPNAMQPKVGSKPYNNTYWGSP